MSAMMTAEMYREIFLKDRTAKQVCENIRVLKNVEDFILISIEDPDFDEKEAHMTLEEVTNRLHRIREYIEEAKETLRNRGCSYYPTEQEKKAQVFDDKIPHIKEVYMSYGNKKEGFKDFLLCLDKDPEYVFQYFGERHQEGSFLFERNTLKKEEFFKEIEDMEMGKWNPIYKLATYGKKNKGGDSWVVEVAYDDGSSISFKGDKVHPYNYERFLKLFL